jgi:hypothetical protein
MTGSHEVRGSIPLSSTAKDFKGLEVILSPFFMTVDPPLYTTGIPTEHKKDRTLPSLFSPFAKSRKNRDRRLDTHCQWRAVVVTDTRRESGRPGRSRNAKGREV